MRNTSFSSKDGVEGALAALRGTRQRVRLFYGDEATGRDWLEEFDVTGTIGRSAGREPIYILIPNARSSGGGGISPTSIVRIMADGRDVYRHPSYHLPKMTIDGLTVLVGGEPHARFKSKSALERWVAFMEGRRMAK